MLPLHEAQDEGSIWWPILRWMITSCIHQQPAATTTATVLIILTQTPIRPIQWLPITSIIIIPTSWWIRSLTGCPLFPSITAFMPAVLFSHSLRILWTAITITTRALTTTTWMPSQGKTWDRIASGGQRHVSLLRTRHPRMSRSSMPPS